MQVLSHTGLYYFFLRQNTRPPNKETGFELLWMILVQAIPPSKWADMESGDWKGRGINTVSGEVQDGKIRHCGLLQLRVCSSAPLPSLSLFLYLRICLTSWFIAGLRSSSWRLSRRRCRCWNWTRRMPLTGQSRLRLNRKLQRRGVSRYEERQEWCSTCVGGTLGVTLYCST